MSLKFYIGASGTGKSTRVYEDMLALSEANKRKRIIVLAPDQFTMQTQKQLCHMSKSGGIMNIEVLSFSRLAHRVFEEKGISNLPLLDDTGKNLILRFLANKQKDQLKMIGAHMKKPGYIAQVKSMISEFSQYGVRTEDLDAMILQSKAKGNLSQKLADLKLMYIEYLAYIQGHYLTVEETMDLLTRLVPESELLHDSIIVFDGYTGFTPIQYRLIRELFLKAEQLIFTLIADTKKDLEGEVGEETLFYLTAKTYQQLQKIAMEYQIKRDEDVVLCDHNNPRFKNHAALAHLEKNLFRKYAKTSEESDGIVISQLTSQRTEVLWCASQISRLIRTEGYSYRDFAIITGDMESYGRVLREVFEEQEIPLFLDQNRSLLKHPFMVFLYSLLRVVTTGFTYESVMQCLRTGYLSIEEENIDLLELYIKRYGIRGTKKYQRLFVRPDAKLEEINKIREQIIGIFTPLIECDKSTRGYTKAIYDICVKEGIEEKLKKQSDIYFEQNLFAKAKEEEQVYAAVMRLLNQIYELMDEPIKLDEYLDILKAGFAELKVSSIPQSVDQVVAGDMERTRLKPIKVLFLIGVNDGIIPGGGAGMGLLSQLERSFLIDAGNTLAPTLRQKGFMERLYLYMNMTQPSCELYLSYAQTSFTGTSMRPSYLIRTIKNLFPDLCVKQYEDEEGLDFIESRESALQVLSAKLRDFASGLIKMDSAEYQLLMGLSKELLHDEEYSALLQAAFYQYESKMLSDSTSESLFGKALHTSISRLETFAGCAYAHFLKYGLKLREEEEFTFEAVDLGNLFHGTLYEYGEFLKENNQTWMNVDVDTAEQFVEKSVDQFAAQYKNTVLYDTARNSAMLPRLKEILNQTIATLSFQLEKGLFEPAAYELSFQEKLSNKVTIYGKIDRVDTASSAKDNTKYLKVIDYKSSEHSFDPLRLFQGLDLQLMLYMNTVLNNKDLLSLSSSAKPAAVFYYQVCDPYTDASPSDSLVDCENRRKEKMKVSGLMSEEDEVLELLDTSMVSSSLVIPAKRKKSGELTSGSQTAPAEQFEQYVTVAREKAIELSTEILKGDIDIHPIKDGDTSACTYCGYRSICGFDERIKGFEYRKGNSEEGNHVS